ncbi:hypothetical protein GG804_05895 [Sphingomonas histidinilytica]|uniref:Carboxymuconolactone decarboxylase family protein n=1 Tax=Rhizorhabdus histidinilytica TaxID=439228 RepID=A0A1T5CWX0_9SPHN|nr:hypothetical protein [Rhizorhabdus histidinilytica]MBO9376291.1 hypothetical protein [Rhizorhabdus histidinilytica]SKB63964.1 hypothetical protein SAMN06295920_104382 [Rhizorhabdus histidinilytica]
MTNISPLEFAEIGETLQKLFQPTVDRLGYFGDFFRYGSHAPDVLSAFMGLSVALKGAIPDDVNETVALTVCQAMDFPYERIQHERLSVKLGFDREWIAAMVGRPSAAETTPLQQAARALSIAIVEGRHDAARDAAEQVASLASPGLAVALLFQATRFMQVCAVGRTLGMQLALPSIFDSNAGQ